MIGNNLNVFLRTVVQIVLLLGFMFFIQWALTLVTFTIVPIVVVLSHVYGQYVQNISKLTQSAVAEATSVAEESASAMHTVRSFGAEQTEVRVCK